MRIRAFGVAVGAALVLSLSTAAVATAHVVKNFGPYSVALGWMTEPTYVGSPNAVVAIVKDKDGKAVNDLASGDLKVVVSAAGQSTAALPLNPSYDPDTGLGTPGQYAASLTPTEVGDYTFHLSGSIHGQAVDETATSSDQTFNSVTSGSDVQFPVKEPALGDVAALAQRVDTRAASAQTAATSAQDAANRASDHANRALLVGVVVGGLGVLIGLAGLAVALRASRRRA